MTQTTEAPEAGIATPVEADLTAHVTNGIENIMTPPEIVAELDKYIIGQHDAKRAVAIALRSRWRRMQLPAELRKEISPKNILMIGPTGVGKTEIARRVAVLSNAPFIKVEATKYTEVGYVGRDVESMIRDLVDISVKQMREGEMAKMRSKADDAAEERVLDALLPQPKGGLADSPVEKSEESATRQLFRKKLRQGELNDKEVEIELSAAIGVEIMAPPGMEEMTSQLQGLFQNLSGDRLKRRKLKVKDALKQLREEEAAKLINEEDIRARALENVEQNGIVFIDEIDKIVKRGEYSSGSDVSREGVQRDLLPLIEGCSVSTKYGILKTDHILFITSGAFQLAKPSDLVPELQGRLPIRVELKPLTAADFSRILTEPKASITCQYIALMQTEGFAIEFAEEGIKRIAEIAYQVNERTENIGARRLYTIMERLLESVSFDAHTRKGSQLIIDADYVNKQIPTHIHHDDLSRYIL